MAKKVPFNMAHKIAMMESGLDQVKPKTNIAPRSFSPKKDFLTNTDGKYVGEFEFEDGRLFTVVQTPKGFVATTPTNAGNVVNSGYFENVDDLYEDLLYNGEADKLSSIARNSQGKRLISYVDKEGNPLESYSKGGTFVDEDYEIVEDPNDEEFEMRFGKQTFSPSDFMGKKIKTKLVRK